MTACDQTLYVIVDRAHHRWLAVSWPICLKLVKQYRRQILRVEHSR